jgi:phytoene dehydrogenase-like protein
VEHGRAVGVSLADGTEIDAGAVVSAMDARQTFLALLPESVTPKSYTKRLGCASASASFFIVSVVADLDPAQHGADGTDVFLCKLDDARDLAAHPEKAISLSFPRYRHGPVSPGRHGVQIVCRAPAEFGARWSQLVCPERHVPTAAHCAVADGVAEKLVHEAEALLPGLSSRVVGTHVQTPITLYRDTRNERGAAVGWGWGTGQPGAAGGSPEERQRCGFVERLYHAGHWYGPSGIPAVLVSGRTAAGLCLSEWR